MEIEALAIVARKFSDRTGHSSHRKLPSRPSDPDAQETVIKKGLRSGLKKKKKKKKKRPVCQQQQPGWFNCEMFLTHKISLSDLAHAEYLCLLFKNLQIILRGVGEVGFSVVSCRPE